MKKLFKKIVYFGNILSVYQNSFSYLFSKVILNLFRIYWLVLLLIGRTSNEFNRLHLNLSSIINCYFSSFQKVKGRTKAIDLISWGAEDESLTSDITSSEKGPERARHRLFSNQTNWKKRKSERNIHSRPLRYVNTVCGCNKVFKTEVDRNEEYPQKVKL